MIHVSNNTCRRGECKASKANSSTNVFNSITGQIAINNASIVISTSVAGKTKSMQEDFKTYRNHYNLWTCIHLP